MNPGTTGDQIIQTRTDSDRDKIVKCAIESCIASKRPCLVIVASRDYIKELADAYPVTKCTADSNPDELRTVPSTSQVIVGLALQIAERISKKQLKRSWFKCILIVDLNEILARGCRDQVQEILKDVLEDTRLLITCGTPGPIPNDVLSFKKYLKDPQITQNHVQKLSLSRVHSYFINYKHNGWKIKKLFELIKTNSQEPTIIVCNSRRTVEKLAEELQQFGVQANTLHADLAQSDRNDVVTMFLSGMTQYLIATELAYNSVSRDIQNSLIVNYDMPLTREKYINRVGEPHSSNLSKTVINFIVDDDSRLLRDIERNCGVSIEEMIANVAI